MTLSALPPAAAEIRVPLVLLAAAGFLSSIGARIVDPLLAVLAEDFKTSVSMVSLMITAFTFSYGCNQMVLGPIGDRFGKLKVLLGALVGYALFMAGCAWASDLPTLMVLRACAGAASAGMIPTCIAYIGDYVPYAERQVVLSRFVTGVVLAQALAGPLGGVFGEFFGWRGAFLVLALGGVGVAVALAARLRHLPDRSGGTGAIYNRATYLELLRHRPARLLLGITIIEGILLPGVFPFVAPYLAARFDLSHFSIGLIISCLGLGALVYARFAAPLLARLGEAGLVLCGGLLVAITLGVALVLDHWAWFILVGMALGLGYFMLHGVMQARASELAPEARGTAVSLFILMLFLGQGLGAVLMGAAIAAWGYDTAFLAAVGGTVLLTLWLADHIRRTGVPAASPEESR